MVYWQDKHRVLYNKDCRSMIELPDESIQVVVTSPPYWGLRKYSGNQDLIWGDNNCQHEWAAEIVEHDNLRFRGEHSIVGNEKNPDIHRGKKTAAGICSLCGAWKGQLGLEPTPELYLDHLVGICREIRRVMCKDACFFLNIGDSYASNPGNKNKVGGFQANPTRERSEAESAMSHLKRSAVIKSKDLCLIPFRLAISLQEDGWWVRSVIIWSKNNPMPESATDRPTESHEYILMLTKSARYYWDAEAVREPYQLSSIERVKYPVNAFGTTEWGVPLSKTNISTYANVEINPAGRNIRSVWTFPTQGYPEAHFATYPEKLVEICVKAATPEIGCCSKCGKPWTRIVEKVEPYTQNGLSGRSGQPHSNSQQTKGEGWYHLPSTRGETLGWQPACKCKDADKVPSIVLDPFAGSGTTLKVAAELGRRSIGYELSEEYCRLAVERNKQAVLL